MREKQYAWHLSFSRPFYRIQIRCVQQLFFARHILGALGELKIIHMRAMDLAIPRGKTNVYQVLIIF